MNILYSPKNIESECHASMDAEKAFDRVEWNYLFIAHEKFGLGPVFTSWIKLLYACHSASVLTNSRYSSSFDLHRGTRQGSLLLFAIAIEQLAIAIRGKKRIQGIWRRGIGRNVSLYADDLLLFVSKTATSLPVALSVLEVFSPFSGYKLPRTLSD